SACSSRKEEMPAFHELAADASAVSNDRKWKSFVLAGYGLRSYKNPRLCPETWRICQKIPALITVMVFILEPSKHMPPHPRPYHGVLRLDLGLIVPRYSCRKPDLPPAGGEVVIFDDAYEHEAWNDTSNTRGVVLFVDFRKPRVFQPI